MGSTRLGDSTRLDDGASLDDGARPGAAPTEADLAAASSPEAVLAVIGSLGVIPVVELGALEQAEPLLEALRGGGLPAAELTLRTPAGLGAIAALARSHPECLIGAGTVRTAREAAAVIEAGARFVVSPGTNAELIRLCIAHDVLVMPGACTPTEVQTAIDAGARAVKFFPAEQSGGVPYLKALAGPFRDVRFVPTGGVKASNLADYLRLPQVIACGGSFMVAPSLLAAGELGKVKELAAEAVGIVAEARRDD